MLKYRLYVARSLNEIVQRSSFSCDLSLEISTPNWKFEKPLASQLKNR